VIAPSLTDGVVILRPPDERDLEAIELGIHDPDVVRWFGRPSGSAAEVLALNRSRWARGSPTLSICEAGEVCIGHVWVNLGAKDPAIGYLGYWLLPAARGRGLATRAVRLISGWALRELGIDRLQLHAEPANEPSHGVAERSGFRRVGMIPGNGAIDGRSVDQVVFELPPEALDQA